MKLVKRSRILLVVSLTSLMVVSSSFAETDFLKKKSGKKAETVTVIQMPADTVAISEKTSLQNFLAISPEIPDEVTFCGQVIDLRKTNMRERFDREMLSMMYMHSSTLLLLKRANRYFPVIEPILKANNIPDDMKYLACIESNLDYKAISSSMAIGMWQFMPETARQYGLEVDENVDERYHVQKETEAACRYLKSAYDLFKDWPSVAASYNGGTSRICKELTRQGERTSLNLWLVEQTSRYVFRILACKEFMSNPQKYGFYMKKEQLYMPSECKDTVVTGSVSNWVDFAKAAGITYYDLKDNNNWIRSDSLPNPEGKAYKVAIPLKESLYFDKKKITVHQKNWVIDED